MTAANRFDRDGPAASALRRCVANVGAAFALLIRPAKRHPPPPWPVSPRQLAIAAAIVLAVFLICMILIDGPVARAVTRAPRWVIWPFDQITDFGLSGWFLWPLGLVFLALAALPATLTRFSQAVLAAVMVRVGFLFLAIGVPGLFVTTVKRMIGRARPLATGHVDPFAFAPFIWRADYASLPSGHATTAFSVLVAFGTLWPRARTALLLYALAIAASRVMVMAHYPSDVLAGAVVGTVGALMVRRYFALRRLGFSAGPGGELHQYPGPSLKRIKAVARELLAP
jgi:membrane-associated phospholipid phosphatase